MEEKEAEQLEQEHVHEVYDRIASHFSQTRYKPWPIVERFLKSLPAGSVGLDIGCGNGKYLAVANPGIYIFATDRSAALVRIAAAERKTRGADVGVADGIEMPVPSGRFDFAISIAVVHHFATRARRIEAVRSVLRGLREGKEQGGKALIYVWALEQGSSRRGWDEGDSQDVMVPWVTRRKKKEGEEEEERVEKRYYHLYRKGELEEDIEAAGGVVVENGYERDNWWAVASR